MVEMSQGSGEGSPPVHGKSETGFVSTTFVPRTNNYEYDTTRAELDVTTQRPLQYIQSTFGELGSSPVTTQASIIVSSSNETAKPPEIPFPTTDNLLVEVDGFTTATLSHSTALATVGDDDRVVLIVGVTCGVVGLLVGIIATALVWIYLHKRKKPNLLNRSRHASVAEKNPKEMTFEPLDLSLTLPSYGRGSSTLETRKSLTEIVAASNSTPKLNHFSDISEESNHSYQGFDPPTPPLASNGIYVDDFISYENGEQLSEIKHEHSYINGQFCHHDNVPERYDDIPAFVGHHSIGFKSRHTIHGNNAYEHVKRPSSIATRDSFSSGLGTGTESDTLPYESRRSVHLPASAMASRDGVSCQYDLPVVDKALYAKHDMNRRSRNNALGVVRENAGRRSKRSTSSNNKRRAARTSDASSTYASSGTTEWSSTETSYSPASSTLPSTNGIPSATSQSPPIDEEDKLRHQMALDQNEQWYSSESSDDEWEGRDDKGETEDDGKVDIVSTYFDMHFPPTPMRLSKSQSVQDTCTIEPTPTVRQTRPVTLIRHNSDVVIDL